MKLHLCLASQGKASDCQTCSVGQAGLLDDFLDLLSRQTYFLRSKFHLQDADREDIMAEFVILVHERVAQFRGLTSDGLRTVKFRTWARTLFAGVEADYFRKKLGRRNKGESPPEMVDISELTDPPSFDPGPSLDAALTLSALLQMLKKDALKSHVALLIDHYEWQEQGLSQKEMAMRAGIAHEAFRKKISRARKVVLSELGETS